MNSSSQYSLLLKTFNMALKINKIDFIIKELNILKNSQYDNLNFNDSNNDSSITELRNKIEILTQQIENLDNKISENETDIDSIEELKDTLDNIDIKNLETINTTIETLQLN